MRQRQAKYRSRCSVRSPCATRKPRRGRPFASLLRRGGETSGVGRRDRRTLCASVARPVWAAHPQFSCSARIACSAKAALRRLGTRSELARQALKSSVAKHGQFLEGPSLRQKRQNSQSIDKRHTAKRSVPLLTSTALRNPRSLGTAGVAHEGACRRAPKRAHSAQWKWRRNAVAEWPTTGHRRVMTRVHDDATMGDAGCKRRCRACATFS